MIIGPVLLYSLLSLTLLLGQVPYQSRFCRLMQRSIDAHMLQSCMKRHVAADNHHPRMVLSSSMMQILEKPILSTFQKDHHTDQGSADIGTAIIFDPTFLQLKLHRPMVDDLQLPPPDIVLLNRNLRI